MLVYFFRHSETEWNSLGKLNGLTDVSLSKTGEAEAYLVKQEIGNLNFDKVYASPLKRAIDTASILSGYDVEEIVKCREIIERDYGILEGKEMSSVSMDELEEKSESHIKIIRRSVKFLRDLAKEYTDEAVYMVVSHRAILRHVYTYMTKSDYQAIDFDNLGFFVAKYDDKKWSIKENSTKRSKKSILQS